MAIYGPRLCRICEKDISGRRKQAKTCGDAHRQQLSRRNRRAHLLRDAKRDTEMRGKCDIGNRRAPLARLSEDPPGAHVTPESSSRYSLAMVGTSDLMKAHRAQAAELDRIRSAHEAEMARKDGQLRERDRRIRHLESQVGLLQDALARRSEATRRAERAAAKLDRAKDRSVAHEVALTVAAMMAAGDVQVPAPPPEPPSPAEITAMFASARKPAVARKPAQQQAATGDWARLLVDA
jgi:hypothetical protein